MLGERRVTNILREPLEVLGLPAPLLIGRISALEFIEHSGAFRMLHFGLETTLEVCDSVFKSRPDPNDDLYRQMTLPLENVPHNRGHELACVSKAASQFCSNCIGLT